MNEDMDTWSPDGREYLHQQAFLALRGFAPGDEGARTIARLLRSSHDLDPIIRLELAEALHPIEGRSGAVSLTLDLNKQGKFARAFRVRQKKLAAGDFYNQCINEGSAREAAFSETTKRWGISAASLEKAITYANACAAWCELFHGDQSRNAAGFESWRIHFIAADIEQVTPDEMVKRHQDRIASLEGERAVHRVQVPEI